MDRTPPTFCIGERESSVRIAQFSLNTLPNPAGMFGAQCNGRWVQCRVYLLLNDRDRQRKLGREFFAALFSFSKATNNIGEIVIDELRLGYSKRILTSILSLWVGGGR